MADTISTKVTLIFIDPMSHWLLAQDYDNTVPIPRIGDTVCLTKQPEHRKVTDVVYVYEKDLPNYVMIAIHLSQVI